MLKAILLHEIGRLHTKAVEKFLEVFREVLEVFRPANRNGYKPLA